mgnify:CR=1 FL=1
MLAVVTAIGCAAPPQFEEAAWAVRTLPTDDGWAVRWAGEAQARVDGVVRAERGLIEVNGAVPHQVAVGAVRFPLPPTPASPCAPVRFVALGDGRAAVDGVGPSAYWPGILAEALARGPDFVLNTGDLVKNGRDPVEWAAFLRTLPPWPPVVSVRGNHDRGRHFKELGLTPDTVFSWRVGPLLIVGFDSEAGAEDRLEAVDRALSEAAPWKILMMHRPVWSRGNHGSDEMGLNAHLVPIIDRRGVDLVLSGHDHDYERFCPSRGVGQSRRCTAPGDGAVYVVTGGAATFTNPVPGVSTKVDPTVAEMDEEASVIFSGAHHFVEFHAGPRSLEGIARRTRTGNVRPAGELDRFRLEREAPECPR